VAGAPVPPPHMILMPFEPRLETFMPPAQWKIRH
jgi:hypothetical protein